MEQRWTLEAVQLESLDKGVRSSERTDPEDKGSPKQQR